MSIYHDGDSKWAEGLHFKYVNQPTHLILQDQNGFETDFYATDLSHALEIRDTKTIHDYQEITAEVVHLSPDKRPPPLYMRYTWIIKTKEGK